MSAVTTVEPQKTQRMQMTQRKLVVCFSPQPFSLPSAFFCVHLRPNMIG